MAELFFFLDHMRCALNLETWMAELNAHKSSLGINPSPQPMAHTAVLRNLPLVSDTHFLVFPPSFSIYNISESDPGSLLVACRADTLRVLSRPIGASWFSRGWPWSGLTLVVGDVETAQLVKTTV